MPKPNIVLTGAHTFACPFFDKVLKQGEGIPASVHLSDEQYSYLLGLRQGDGVSLFSVGGEAGHGAGEGASTAAASIRRISVKKIPTHSFKGGVEQEQESVLLELAQASDTSTEGAVTL
jgi:hypothetical protein